MAGNFNYLLIQELTNNKFLKNCVCASKIYIHNCITWNSFAKSRYFLLTTSGMFTKYTCYVNSPSSRVAVVTGGIENGPHPTLLQAATENI